MFMLLPLLFRIGNPSFHRANAGNIFLKKHAGITTFDRHTFLTTYPSNENLLINLARLSPSNLGVKKQQSKHTVK